MFRTINILQLLKSSVSNIRRQASKISNVRRIQARFLCTSDPIAEPDDEVDYDFMENILQYKKASNLPGARKVFIVMPRQKFGNLHRTKDQGNFLMDETKTLIESIQGWRVIGSEMISTSSVNSRQIFGSTNLEALRDYIKDTDADTVVFALDNIMPIQHQFFQELLDTEVLDRFGVVLRIFNERAATKEAKLQLSLAELYYVRRNLHHLSECDFNKFVVAQSFGGKFDTFYQVKKKLIQDMEMKIKRKLVKIERDNSLQKQHRNRLQIPTVAVVGYTNSGKTSLIKALTYDQRLTPEDKLFATVSTSVHEANLPTLNMKALFIDTIGFITEMPTTLIHCFKTTLSEILSADLIVHVTDASHPDYQLQIDTVHRTLQEIQVPDKLIETMIQVENKVDKLNNKDFEGFVNEHSDSLCISATERIGLKELYKSIENQIMENTDRIRFKIRVPNGGPQYQWLRSEVTIVDCLPDPKQGNSIILDVVMTESQIGKFKKLFD